MTYKRQATILLAVPIICNAFTAPSRNFIQQSSTLTLESHHKNRNNELESSMKILSGGLAAFILGLGTAANVALAAPADLDMNFGES